jgi:Flp pilus assembly protein TadG
MSTGRLSNAKQDRRFVHCDEGSNVVKMAVVSPVLFAMLFGIVEISLALYTYNYVSDAAREGTRYAIVRGSSCNVLTKLQCDSNADPDLCAESRYPGVESREHRRIHYLVQSERLHSGHLGSLCYAL